MDKFTTLAGFGSVASARTVVNRTLKAVMGEGTDADAAGDATPTAAKKKATPRKRKGGEIPLDRRHHMMTDFQ
jgi:hypothetical protein